MRYSYSLEHAIEQLKELKDNGLPKILFDENYHYRAYTFSNYNGCIIINDNNGNIMSISDMKRLVEYINYSIENINETEIINNKIKHLEDEVNEYMKPNKKVVKIAKTDGFVYLIQGENNRYKIGCSKDPKRRCKELKLSSCENHELIYYFYTDDMYKIEKELHLKFGDKRLHSEWFDLSNEDVEYIKGIKHD